MHRDLICPCPLIVKAVKEEQQKTNLPLTFVLAAARDGDQRFHWLSHHRPTDRCDNSSAYERRWCILGISLFQARPERLQGCGG